jgi:L-asparaginase II
VVEAHVVRNGFVESVHRAAVVVTRADRSVELVHGDGAAPMLPRSAMKPLQALAMVRAGLQLPAPLLALACASHSGEDFHLDGVRQILDGAGLTTEDLQNTPDLPLGEASRAAWIRAGREPERLAQNCSGKHAAMLATCRIAGWDTASYRDAGHSLQRAIAAAAAELAGEPVAATVVDGCGAPAMAVSLTGLARAYGALAAAPDGTPEGVVAAAMRTAPEYVGGTGRDVTALMQGVPGLIAKDGAEAVYAVGLPDGRGIALKVADGGQRARPVILAAALRRIGIDAPVLDELAHAPVLGHGEPVGSIVAVGI